MERQTRVGSQKRIHRRTHPQQQWNQHPHTVARLQYTGVPSSNAPRPTRYDAHMSDYHPTPGNTTRQSDPVTPPTPRDMITHCLSPFGQKVSSTPQLLHQTSRNLRKTPQAASRGCRICPNDEPINIRKSSVRKVCIPGSLLSFLSPKYLTSNTVVAISYEVLRTSYYTPQVRL